MIIKTYKPNPLLSEYIQYYWTMRSSSNDINESALVYPEGKSELMFHFADRFVSQPMGGAERTQFQSMFCPQKTIANNVGTNGKTDMLAVTFTPYGASAFFGFDQSECLNEDIDLCSIWGDKYRTTWEMLAEIDDDTKRIEIIEKTLIKSIKFKQREFEILKYGIKAYNQRNGMMSVQEAADMTYVSPRHFERVFLKNIGLTPTAYSKIKRINYSIELINSKKFQKLSDIAYDSGFFDQSHFTHTFKSIISITPKEFINLSGKQE